MSNPWFSGNNKGFNKGYNKSDNKAHSDSKSHLDFDNDFDSDVDSASKSRNKNTAVSKIFKSGNSEVYIDAKVYSDANAKVRAKAESDQDQDQKQYMRNKQNDFFFGKQYQKDEDGHDYGKKHKY